MIPIFLFFQMHRHILFFLDLRLSVTHFQMPLEGLRFVKTFVTSEIIYVTDPLLQNMSMVVCLLPPGHAELDVRAPILQNHSSFLHALLLKRSR